MNATVNAYIGGVVVDGQVFLNASDVIAMLYKAGYKSLPGEIERAAEAIRKQAR